MELSPHTLTPALGLRISAFFRPSDFGLRISPMLPHLDRKLWRDLRRMKGQALAVALVMACGLAMMIMARSLIYSLESTRREYYEANRFAEVFAAAQDARPTRWRAQSPRSPAWRPCRRASRCRSRSTFPASMSRPAAWCVRCRISAQPELNRLFLRSGRLAGAGQPRRGAGRRGLCRRQSPAAGRHSRHAAQRQTAGTAHRRHRALARNSSSSRGPARRCRTTAPTAFSGCPTRRSRRPSTSMARSTT